MESFQTKSISGKASRVRGGAAWGLWGLPGASIVGSFFDFCGAWSQMFSIRQPNEDSCFIRQREGKKMRSVVRSCQKALNPELWRHKEVRAGVRRLLEPQQLTWIWTPTFMIMLCSTPNRAAAVPGS